jgi:uncharacterized membrane protein YgcG
MAANTSRSFRLRSFTSVLIGIGALVLAVTGAVLFIVPPGRIANWGGWSLFGLTKSQWQALHITFALLFLLASMLHLFYNWRPLVGYFRSAPRRRLGFRWEWVLALGVGVLVVVGTLEEVPPFSTLMTVHEDIKHRWDRQESRAPVPHAELLTLDELAAESGVELEEMLRNLEASGVSALGEQKLEEIAEAHGRTPQDVYRIAAGTSPEPGRGRGGGGSTARRGGRGGGGGGAGGGGGGGVGRKTLEELCREEEIDLSTALERLRARGLEANGTLRAREAADLLGVHPREIPEILSGRSDEESTAESPEDGP